MKNIFPFFFQTSDFVVVSTVESLEKEKIQKKKVVSKRKAIVQVELTDILVTDKVRYA